MNWKESGMKQSLHVPGGTKETTKDLRLAAVPVEIPVEHLWSVQV
jgi:hypothetical protein